MTTPYRTDKQALLEKKESLARELERLRAETANLEGMRARQAEIAKELSDVDARLNVKRTLPMLDDVRVASPCSAKWDDMVGDERARHCLSCEKNVYNLSAMTREAAEAFLSERLGTEVCVRFYQRADGTIMTQDCSVGVSRKRRKKIALAVAGVGATALAAFSAISRDAGCPRTGKMVMGEMSQVDPQPKADPTVVPIMGSMAIVPPPAPTPVEAATPKKMR